MRQVFKNSLWVSGQLLKITYRRIQCRFLPGKPSAVTQPALPGLWAPLSRSESTAPAEGYLGGQPSFYLLHLGCQAVGSSRQSMSRQLYCSDPHPPPPKSCVGKPHALSSGPIWFWLYQAHLRRPAKAILITCKWHILGIDQMYRLESSTVWTFATCTLAGDCFAQKWYLAITVSVWCPSKEP